MVPMKKKILIPIFGGIFAFIFCFVLATGIQPDEGKISSYEAPRADTKALQKQVTSSTNPAIVASDNENVAESSKSPTIIPDTRPTPSNPEDYVAPENEYIVVGGGLTQSNNLAFCNNSFVPSNTDTDVYWKIGPDPSDGNILTLTLAYNPEEKTGWTQNSINTGSDSDGYIYNTPGWFSSFLPVRKIVIDESMKNAEVTITKSWFSTSYRPGQAHGAPHVNKIVGLSNLNFSSVSDASYMFCGLGMYGLTSVDGSLADKDFSSITDARAMFCTAQVEKLFGSSDISLTFSSNVKYLDYLFQSTAELQTLDLSSSDLSKVTSASYMFCNAQNLKSSKEHPLVMPDTFKLANLTAANAMFCNCLAIEYLDLSSWGNPKDNANLSNMFNSCAKLTTIKVNEYVDTERTVATNWTNATCNYMFYFKGTYGKDYNLVGSNGHHPDAAETDNGAAKVDLAGLAIPGYFTATTTRAVISGPSENASNDTITFYTDDAVKTGNVYQVPENGNTSVPWTNTAKNSVANIAFDSSYDYSYNMDYWFNSFNKIDCINLPSDVKVIGQNCFANCPILRKVVVGDNDSSALTNVNANAFNGCTVLENFVVRKDSGSVAYNEKAFAGAGSSVPTVAAPLVVADKNTASDIPVGGTHYTYTSLASLSDTFTFENNKYYFLSGESYKISETSKEIIAANIDCVIDLNGKNINKGIAKGSQRGGGNVFEIYNGGTLRIDDTKTVDVNSTDLGSITGGRTNGENSGYGSNVGGAAYIAGTCNFVNGKISDCDGNEGGAFALSSASYIHSLNMYGGIITNCQTNRAGEASPSPNCWGGGAIFSRAGGTVNLYRGTISYCVSKTPYGAAVCMSGTGTLNIPSGSGIDFRNNTVTKKGAETSPANPICLCSPDTTYTHPLPEGITEDSLLQKVGKAVLFLDAYSPASNDKIAAAAGDFRFIYDAYNNHIGQAKVTSGSVTGGAIQFDIETGTNFDTNIPWATYASKVKKVNVHDSFHEIQVANLRQWFQGCSNAESITGLANIDASNALKCKQMFSECSKVTNIDLTGMSVSNSCNDMSYLFDGCTVLQTVTLDPATSSDYSGNEWPNSTFKNCNQLSTIKNLSGYVTSTAKATDCMFNGCTALTSVSFTNWNTSNVANMSNMFDGATALKSIDLSGLNTSSVTNMESFCDGCTSLGTFTGPCTYDNKGNKAKTSLGAACNCKQICHKCTSLTSFDFYYCDISNVKSFENAFRYDIQLNSADLSTGVPGNNKSKGCYVNHMFDSGDSGKTMALTTVYVKPEAGSQSTLSESEGTWAYAVYAASDGNMFYNCSNLKGQEGTQCVSGSVQCTKAREDRKNAVSTGFGAHEGYFTRGSFSHNGKDPSRYTQELVAKTQSGGDYENGLVNDAWYRITWDKNSNTYEMNLKGGSGQNKDIILYGQVSQYWQAKIDGNGYVKFVNSADSSMALNLHNGQAYGANYLQSYTIDDDTLSNYWVVVKKDNKYRICSKKDAYLSVNVDNGDTGKKLTVWYDYDGNNRKWDFTNKSSAEILNSTPEYSISKITDNYSSHSISRDVDKPLEATVFEQPYRRYSQYKPSIY